MPLFRHKHKQNAMKKILIFAFAAGVLAACGNKETKSDSVEATEKANEKLDDTNLEDDAEFAVNAAEGGMLEVQLGELAQQNATSPKVKEFGQMMVTDHSKANDELKELAKTKNIALPAALGTERKNKYEELRAKKGNEFDKAYIDYMIKDHKEDIDEFREQSKEGKDADIKAWAGGKLPTLEHHLQMAEEAQKWVKQ